MEMFDALPLAAVIDTQKGKYLAVHGGLSPFIKNVDEIKKLNRFSEPVRFMPALQTVELLQLNDLCFCPFVHISA